MRRLKHNKIKEYREKALIDQGGLCILCYKPVAEGEAALDHCHTHGNVRGVLHRECNVLLGKIENYVQRYGKNRFKNKHDLQMFLSNVFRYMYTDYSSNPLHPTHKTEVDKEIRNLKKRLKNAKRETTKQRLTAEINRLKRRNS